MARCSSASVFSYLFFGRFCRGYQGGLLVRPRSRFAYLFESYEVGGVLSLFFVPSPLVRHHGKFLRTSFLIFLREVISGTDAVHEGAGPSVRAHSICSFYAELVCFQGAGGHILELEFGFCFFLFTVCGVQYVFEGLHSLGPVVAAGSILH